ncbi:MAG TPA: SPASM domain-containing protein [Chitinivibrionales bacterium]|nr:SPASM domain-containing protein [Chitinivibrionales bacterium]
MPSVRQDWRPSPERGAARPSPKAYGGRGSPRACPRPEGRPTPSRRAAVNRFYATGERPDLFFFNIMKPFKRTYIEITNTCNLSCEFCPGTSRTTQFMKPETFEKILVNLGQYSTHLYFHVLGEPLLHPEIAAFLDIAQKHKKLVNLVTNGTLISEKGYLIVGKPALRQVTFSLHSFVDAGKVASVNNYLGQIIDFAKKASQSHIICLRLWDTDADAGGAVGAAMIRHVQDEFDLSYSLMERLQTSSGVNLGKNIFINKTKRFEWPDLSGPDFGETGFCLGLRQQIAILADGTVVPCCLDRNGDMVLGNILSQKIEDIIGSKRAQRILNGFSRRKVAEILCKKCSYRLRFNLPSGLD